jgi:hypothetical protein
MSGGGMFPSWRPTVILRRLAALELQARQILKRLDALEKK